jgi:hypothetical protein
MIQGCSSRIRIPDPDPDFLPIPDPGSRGKNGIGSRIRIRNTEISVSDGGRFRPANFVVFSGRTARPNVVQISSLKIVDFTHGTSGKKI